MYVCFDRTVALALLTFHLSLSITQAEFGFATWQSFPERLVGFVAHKHYWDSVNLQWSYTTNWSNDYSLVLTGALFYHRWALGGGSDTCMYVVAGVCATEYKCLVRLVVVVVGVCSW